MNSENFNNTQSENFNHKIDEYVVYRNNGICRITDICEKDFIGETKLYYHLKSVYDNNTDYYIPVDAEEIDKHIRHILTIEEINRIISDSEDSNNKWIEDSRFRADAFTDILKNGKREDVLWLVKVLSLHKNRVEEEKKKFYASDEKILSAAQKIITEEFAFVLGISRHEVIPYIVDRITGKAAL